MGSTPLWRIFHDFDSCFVIYVLNLNLQLSSSNWKFIVHICCCCCWLCDRLIVACKVNCTKFKHQFSVGFWHCTFCTSESTSNTPCPLPSFDTHRDKPPITSSMLVPSQNKSKPNTQTLHGPNPSANKRMGRRFRVSIKDCSWLTITNNAEIVDFCCPSEDWTELFEWLASLSSDHAQCVAGNG